MTRADLAAGTPRYMAPEQWAAGLRIHAPICSRSACSLFEMLAGKPAFAGKTAIEIHHAVMTTQPPALAGSPAVVAGRRRHSPGNRKTSGEPVLERLGHGRGALRAAMAVGDSMGPSTSVPSRTAHDTPDCAAVPDAASGRRSRLPVVQPAGCRDCLARGPRVARRPVDRRRRQVRRSARSEQAGFGDRRGCGGVRDAASGGRPGSCERAAGSKCRRQRSPGARASRWACAICSRCRTSSRAQSSSRCRFHCHSREQRSSFTAMSPASARAYEFYLRANQIAYDTTKWSVARDLYRSALDDDPNYAPAWAKFGRVLRVIAK